MPADPREAARFIRDPRFQQIGDPRAQVAAFREFLSGVDEDFAGLEANDPTQANDVASKIIDYHQPGWLSKVAEGVPIPIVGGVGPIPSHLPIPVVSAAARGYEAVQTGEEPSLLARVQGAGFEGETGLGRAAREAVPEAGLFALLSGATELVKPALSALAARVGGTALEDLAGLGIAPRLGRVGAAELTGAALKAPTSQVAEKLAGAAARTALRERFITHGFTELTAGGLFATADAIEHGIETGEPPPLSDFIGTTLGGAVLGAGLLGIGGIAKRLGLRNLQPLVEDIAARDPIRLETLKADGARVVDAVRRASGGRLTPEGAGELVYTAMTEPLAAADVPLLRNALRHSPEILDSELGLHLLRTQRQRLLAPETRVTASPGLRVTYDDEAGRTVTELLNERAAQTQFAKRVAEGRVVVDSAAGDQAALARAGLGPGTVVEPKYAPGGGPARLRPEGLGEVVGGGIGGEAQLPAVRPEVVEQSTLVDAAARELRQRGVTGAEQIVAREPGVATSPEDTARRASEAKRGVAYWKVTRGGRIEPVPNVAGRADIVARPGEVIVQAEPGRQPIVVSAGDDVPRGLQRLAVQRVVREKPLALPPSSTDYATLPNGDIVALKPASPLPPPPPDTTVATSHGAQVKVVAPGNAANRVVVDVGNGRTVQAPWNPRFGTVDVPPTLLDLPAVVAAPIPTTGEVVMPRAMSGIREQIRAGQIIHQSIADMNKRGALPSIEVLGVRGDTVLVRSGDVAMSVPIEQVARTIEEGAGKFAFDMSVGVGEVLETSATRFNEYLRDTTPLTRRTPEEFARDLQVADELFSYDKQAGQQAGPSTVAQPANVGRGVDRATRERRQRPAEERTRGGNSIVKGCK